MPGVSVTVHGVEEAQDAFDDIVADVQGAEPRTVGTDVEYASYQEYGTRYMSAQPYLRPAIETVKMQIARYIAATSSLDELLARLAVEIKIEAQRRAPVATGRLRDSIEVRD